MRKIQIFFMVLIGFGLVPELKSQNLQKSNLEQGFEYYFATAQYDKAIKALEILYKRYDLHSVKLNFALDIAVKFKRDDLIKSLLEEDFGDFKVDLPETESFIGEWLGDTTFSFSNYFGKKWPAIFKALTLKQQRYEDNIKGDYYSSLRDFLSVDQFVRFNEVSQSTFMEVDSLNLDNFCNWLLECPEAKRVKSRLNNQTILVLLRHIGPKRFERLNRYKVFSSLLEKEIISPEDYGLMFDYVHNKPMYFIEYDGFVEKSWDKSGIKTRAELQSVDDRRLSIGLLPLEYSGFCLQKGIAVPAGLKYAKPADTLVFGAK